MSTDENRSTIPALAWRIGAVTVTLLAFTGGSATAIMGLWARLTAAEALMLVLGLAIMASSILAGFGVFWWLHHTAVKALREQSKDFLTILLGFGIQDTATTLKLPNGQYNDDPEAVRAYKRVIAEAKTWQPDMVADLRRVQGAIDEELHGIWGKK